MSDTTAIQPQAMTASAARTGFTTDPVQRHHDALFPSVKPYYAQPLVLDHGEGVWAIDTDKNRYLDLFGGILTTSLGHCHPEVVERVREQAGKLGHTSTLYISEPQVAVAERLNRIAPAGLTRTFFTNSGTEAVETAIMAARIHTGRSEIVALRNAYSGRSTLAATVTAHGTWRNANPAPGIVHAKAPHTYRCPYNTPCNADCVGHWIDELVEVIDTTTSGQPAALIFEPIQGVGGFNVLPDEYMRQAAEVIKERGGLLIADEVQTGFGRTGDLWWGIDHAGVAPDLMIMAKGIAAGFPVGATMATDAVAASWTSKTLSTFGGNPICMAAADTTIEIMEREQVPMRAATRGHQLRAGLEAIGERHSWIGNVRGRGLMQALEIVDQATAPDAVRASQLLESTRKHGLLVGLGGLHNNVVRLGPSLLISEAEVTDGVERLGAACAALGD